MKDSGVGRQTGKHHSPGTPFDARHMAGARLLLCCGAAWGAAASLIDGAAVPHLGTSLFSARRSRQRQTRPHVNATPRPSPYLG